MGILKTKKNKKFGYTPRYYKNDGEGSPFQIEDKFDKFRKTVGNNGLKTNFKNAMEDLKSNRDRTSKRRILIIAAILILLFLYFIDFDLSIGFQEI
ncbi:MAG TPA: riboflavin synthase subunit beta [Aequorivita sp.]|nr:riboflavin synthase subunit beta [Aequorivita sp.]